jgi:hypothetical protein
MHLTLSGKSSRVSIFQQAHFNVIRRPIFLADAKNVDQEMYGTF